MSFKEVLWCMEGWDKLEEAKKQERWEMARMGWTFSIMPHSGKKGLQPTELITFPWEGNILKEIDKKIFDQFPDKWPE